MSWSNANCVTTVEIMFTAQTNVHIKIDSLHSSFCKESDYSYSKNKYPWSKFKMKNVKNKLKREQNHATTKIS